MTPLTNLSAANFNTNSQQAAYTPVLITSLDRPIPSWGRWDKLSIMNWVGAIKGPEWKSLRLWPRPLWNPSWSLKKYLKSSSIKGSVYTVWDNWSVTIVLCWILVRGVLKGTRKALSQCWTWWMSHQTRKCYQGNCSASSKIQHLLSSSRSIQRWSMQIWDRMWWTFSI